MGCGAARALNTSKTRSSASATRPSSLGSVPDHLFPFSKMLLGRTVAPKMRACASTLFCKESGGYTLPFFVHLLFTLFCEVLTVAAAQHEFRQAAITETQRPKISRASVGWPADPEDPTMHTRPLCAGGPRKSNEHMRTSCGYCTQLPNSHQPNGHHPTVAQTGDDSWLGTGDGHPPDLGLDEKHPNPTTQTPESDKADSTIESLPPTLPLQPTASSSFRTTDSTHASLIDGR